MGTAVISLELPHLLIAAAIIASIAAGITTLVLYGRYSRRLAIVQRQALRAGADDARKEFVNLLLGRGKYVSDFLTRMRSIAEKSDSASTPSDECALIARDFVHLVEEEFRLLSMSEVGVELPFDPNVHFSYQPIVPGSMVRVIESGWQQNGMILKKAIVEPRGRP